MVGVDSDEVVMTSSSVKSDLYLIYQFGDCSASEGQSQPKFQVVRPWSCGWREGKVVGKEEVTRRRMEIRDVVVTTGEREFTELSVEVWVSAGVLVVSGIEWVSVARESNTRVEQVVKIIAELKC